MSKMKTFFTAIFLFLEIIPKPGTFGLHNKICLIYRVEKHYVAFVVAYAWVDKS